MPPLESDARTVCAVLVDRANYGRLKPVLAEIDRTEGLNLEIIAAGTMPLRRFGKASDTVREEGFRITAEIYTEVEGSTPTSMAKSIGIGIMDFANEFRRIDPEVVLIIGDRYEALSAAIAAAYMNRCIVHIQGGEVSGSIDESARHAITKFAHFHVPATQRARDYIIRLGERPESILTVGCPSSDLAASLDMSIDSDEINCSGSGVEFEPLEPYFLVVYHPTTTVYGSEERQVMNLLNSLGKFQAQTLLLWPNIDAGSDSVSRCIRRYRTENAPNWLRTITNLSPENYLRILARATCAIGNSSSFVRDSGFFGTPVVLVGPRQEGRENSDNVLRVDASEAAITNGIRAQLDAGRYKPSSLYGDGEVSRRITEGLKRLVPYVQKRLDYVRCDVNEELPEVASGVEPWVTP